MTLSHASVMRWFTKSSKFVVDYPVLAPLLALPVALLTLASYVANRSTKGVRTGSAASGIYSSVFMVFRPVGWTRLPEFERKETGYWERKQINRSRAEPKVRAAPRV
jgi:hypothetical protein